MTNTTAANGKEAAAYHGVPAEDDYGYAQAIKIGNTIHVSGQLKPSTPITHPGADRTGSKRHPSLHGLCGSKHTRPSSGLAEGERPS
jgi:hypothetical protein